MDRLTQYAHIITEVLEEVGKQVQTVQIEALLSIDHIRHQYILIADGWEGTKRFYATLVHIDLKEEGKVWLRCDNTDLEIGQMLIEKGIASQDIIPAFYSPKMREYAKAS